MRRGWRHWKSCWPRRRVLAVGIQAEERRDGEPAQVHRRCLREQLRRGLQALRKRRPPQKAAATRVKNKAGRRDSLLPPRPQLLHQPLRRLRRESKEAFLPRLARKARVRSSTGKSHSQQWLCHKKQASLRAARKSCAADWMWHKWQKSKQESRHNRNSSANCWNILRDGNLTERSCEFIFLRRRVRSRD